MPFVLVVAAVVADRAELLELEDQQSQLGLAPALPLLVLLWARAVDGDPEVVPARR